MPTSATIDRVSAPVPPAQLIAPLRQSHGTGYRGVYLARLNPDRVPMYCAKVKRGGRLMRLRGSASTDKRVCAGFVARWYAAEYGDDWPKVLEARKVNPWKVKQNPDGRGYYAAVWFKGARHEVIHLTRAVVRRRRRFHPDHGGIGPAEVWAKPANRRDERLVIYPTREAARKGAEQFAVRLWGIEALTGLYRTDKPRRRFLGKCA